MEKTEFGNKTDFIGPYNYNIFFVVIKIDASRAVQLIEFDSHAHLSVKQVPCQSRNRLYWQDARENQIRLIAQP